MNLNRASLRLGIPLILILGTVITTAQVSGVTNTNSTNPPAPIAIIPNAIVPFQGKPLTVNLAKYIVPPFATTNTTTDFVYVNTSLGDFYIQLFPTNAPNTVANFLDYVTNGLYNGMVVHRSVTNFIIQTGGYDISPTLNYSAITNLGTITNEFGISNTRGTVAMALVGTNPDSATSQWFINLADNSSILDDTNTSGNPPFTVFGQVIGTNGMAIADAINALPIGNYSSPFNELPLNHWSSNSSLAYTNLVIVTNMATVPSVTCIPTNNFSAAFQGTNLIVTPLAVSTSPVTVYVNTADTNGTPITKIFQVSTRKFFQTITFSAPAYNYNYMFYNSNALYSLTNYSPAVASGSLVAASGLPITFSVVSGPASMTNIVTNGVTNSMIRIKGAGWVQLAAHQSGNTFYNAAPAVTAWLQIYKNTNPITFPSIPDQTNGFAGPYTLPIAVTNYPTSFSGLPVTLKVTSGPAKALATKPGLGYAFTITGAGTVTVVATQAGNANYYSALPVTNSFVVTPAP